MCQNNYHLARTIMGPEDYPALETELDYRGYSIVTYPQHGSVTINGVQLAELHTSVISPEGEEWWDTYPIYSNPSGDPAQELEPALRTARWVADNWGQAMEEFHA